MLFDETLRQRDRRKVLYARHLRQTMTPAEQILWTALRGRKCADLKFRRQVPMGPYIVDFLCIERRLVIEIDGGIHATQEVYDRERECSLQQHGFRILRFQNEDVLRNLSGVLHAIEQSSNMNSSLSQ